jgi:hypothetical protein
MNTAAIACYLNIELVKLVKVEEWASVLWVKFIGGCRFVSKKIGAIKMTETQMVRFNVTTSAASGGRTGWMKHVTSVDLAKKDGYAFGGRFLNENEQYELPVGSIVIEKEPTGSVKNGSWEANIWRVVATPQIRGDGSPTANPHLELVNYYKSWSKNFLDFRDEVAQELNLKK